MAFGVFALLCVGVDARAQPAPDYAALIAAPDRSDNDRQADKRRDPILLLTFADVRPGIKVLDMAPAAATAPNCWPVPSRRVALSMAKILPICPIGPKPRSKRG